MRQPHEFPDFQRPGTAVQEKCTDRSLGFHERPAGRRTAPLVPDELPAETIPDCAIAWDNGDYLPIGYEFTWWKDLFPQLKSISVMPGATSIYLAKAYIYLMTRLQFAHLSFSKCVIL